MKAIRFTVIILGIMFSLSAVAQENEIIHVVLNKHCKGLMLNFDNDADPQDLQMVCYNYQSVVPTFEFTNYMFYDSICMYDHSPWSYCWRSNYGDTITPQMSWTAWGNIWFEQPSDETFYSPIRHKLPDGRFCYGWIHYRVYCEQAWILASCWVDFYDYAYCTEPGYPLRVGQTSYDWDAVDQTAIPGFTVHPNPTEGFFTINGEDLEKVEVYNALGQCVFTQLANGNTMDVYLQNQPAGIYFVNITNEDGKRYVKKVVKQ